ncbi:GNAT family N-acetyltransferase [Miniimonas arenae]|uniref:GNAT family N-acetyltransferase n=1 Tax=Miniimonas arenae TaxID=676201 RepID=A0A5C5BEF8_9MICO|nr:GNAT family N-acetyltransferase [Miniimonas arenae]TNU74895.1 GNAT family N-acetyltransferase [Miniimonas arenae]
MTAIAADDLVALRTSVTDPLVEPLLADLAREYRARYSDVLTEDDLRGEMAQYPPEQFLAPGGVLLVLVEERAGRRAVVAGGAFRRRTEPEAGDAARARPGARREDGTPAVATAELKRIWTHPEHRRRGLARRVLAELERDAWAVGYPRIYLTTGPRQPEAAALYRRAGYTPLFDVEHPPTEGPLAFEKWR